MTHPSHIRSAASLGKPHGVQGPELTLAAFHRIAGLAKREAGLDISEGKAAMVRTRLARRLRELGMTDYDSYCEILERDEPYELSRMISALTTNVSHFYREPHHFDSLRNLILPDVKKRIGRNPLRIWSAGCANGQEPYSIAIELLDAGLTPADARVLATDIDPIVIGNAKRGIYDKSMTGGLTQEALATHFNQYDTTRFQVKPTLREYISFKQLNLLHLWPNQKKFDVIFCRNVVIYFDKSTQSVLWKRFAVNLSAEGHLFLGHSERIDDAASAFFEKVGVTTYKRNSAAGTNIKKDL